MLDAEPTTAASQIPVTLPAQLPPAAPGRRRRRRATAGASAQPDGGGDVPPTHSQRKNLAKTIRMQWRQSKKEAAEQAKMLNRANKSGECVWHALLKGVIGLNSVRSHDQLLKCVKARCDPTKLARVSWNGTPFRPQECEEMMVALGRLRIESGYNCGSCDPLLSAVAGVYRSTSSTSTGGTGMRTRCPARAASLKSARLRHTWSMSGTPNRQVDGMRASPVPKNFHFNFHFHPYLHMYTMVGRRGTHG
jgi:hypothetical protein